MAKKETPAQQRKVKKVMHEFKEGKLKGGKGKHPKVKSRRQAIAIALSEAGVPPKPGTSRAKAAKKKPTSRTTKKTTRRTTATRSATGKASKKAPTRTARKSPVRKRAGAKRPIRSSTR